MYLIKLYLLFIMFSFIGYLIEVLAVYKEKKVLVNRGFLLGPICPIYGFGSILIILFLNKYKSYPVLVYIMSSFFIFIVEYLTSYYLEIIFNKKWWDYKNKKYNIKGRVCLINILLFGILGLLGLYVIYPFYLLITDKLSTNILIIIFILIFILHITDSITSIIYIKKVKKIKVNIKDDYLIKREVNIDNTNKKYKRSPSIK